MFYLIAENVEPLAVSDMLKKINVNGPQKILQKEEKSLKEAVSRDFWHFSMNGTYLYRLIYNSSVLVSVEVFYNLYT